MTDEKILEQRKATNNAPADKIIVDRSTLDGLVAQVNELMAKEEKRKLHEVASTSKIRVLDDKDQVRTATMRIYQATADDEAFLISGWKRHSEDRTVIPYKDYYTFDLLPPLNSPTKKTTKRMSLEEFNKIQNFIRVDMLERKVKRIAESQGTVRFAQYYPEQMRTVDARVETSDIVSLDVITIQETVLVDAKQYGKFEIDVKFLNQI